MSKKDIGNTDAKVLELAPGLAERMPHSEEAAEDRARAELDKKARPLSAFLGASIEQMAARANGTAKPIPLPWPSVSERLGGGLWPGLHVLTGGTGQGKSALALQVAFAAAREGVPTLYIGLELDEIGISARLLALMERELHEGRGKSQWSDFYMGKRDPSGLKAEIEHLLSFPCFRCEFAPPHGWPASNLYERVKQLRDIQREETPGSCPLLVVLDYLQVVGAEERANSELRERISKAAYQGRAAAKDFRAAVLVLSSVSRENAKPATDKPSNFAPAFVGLGKESGDIEYAADSVMALLPQERDERERVTPTRLAVAKVRAGKPGFCELEFDGTCFAEANTGKGGGITA